MGRIGHSLLASVLLVLPLSLASAASSPSSPSPSQHRSEPPVLVGPVRVKLVGGKTLEGIAVIREENRVRLILEDGSEIAFDPLKVSSVIALADLGKEPAKGGSIVSSRSVPPTPEISEDDLKPGASRGEKPVDRQKGRLGQAASANAGAKKPAPSTGRGSAAPATGGKGDAARYAGQIAGVPKGAPAKAPTASEVAAPAGNTGAAPSGEASTGEDRERDENIAQLAAMLEHAIVNAETESRRGGQDSGAQGGEGAEGVTLEPPPPATDPAKKEQAYVRPKLEDFDATRPVLQPGVRFIGRKGELPSTPPPLPDFPKPAPPTVSLGPSIWHPSSGFSSSAKWPNALAPATSFSNQLSGFGKPTTSLGPTWWNPKPIQWPSSIFPDNWQPVDGFAQSQSRKESSRPGSGSPK